MQTRKHPRTLNEAFGPYTSHHISEPEDTGYGWAWWITIVLVSIIGVIVIVAGTPA